LASRPPDPVAFTRHGAIARVVLGPGMRVPLLDVAALEAIGRSVKEARAAGVRALVLAGGTEGTFAAGADLKELSRLDPLGAKEFSRRGQALLDGMARFPGVILAAIRGRCIGGAFDLVMACDLRLASEEATFAHPGPRMGFITGYGGTSRLPLLAGAASRPVLAGWREMDAASALRAGLLAAVAPAGRLDAGADALAARIAGAPLERLLLIKEALRRLGPSRRHLVLERGLAALAGYPS
jgi:enoyl-CoA hydratase/carnithine racemase